MKSIACGTLVLALVTIQAHAATSTITLGEIRGIAGKCLDTDPKPNDSKAQIWECTGAKSQQWMIIPITGEIRATGGKCLDVTNANPAEFTRVQLWPCNGSSAQQWRYLNGEIRGLGGKCLDVDNADTRNGTAVQMVDCNGTNAQSWVLPR